MGFNSGFKALNIAGATSRRRSSDVSPLVRRAPGRQLMLQYLGTGYRCRFVFPHVSFVRSGS